MNNQWISLKEAESITGKSNSTLRRYIKIFKEDKKRVQYTINNKGQNYYELELNNLCEYMNIKKASYENKDSQKNNQKDSQEQDYSYSQETSQKSSQKEQEPQNNKHAENIKYAEFALEKQQNDIISELVKQRETKTPILRHSTFWTAVFFIILLAGLGVAVYYFYIFSITQKETYYNDKIDNYSSKLTDLKTEIATSETEYKNNIIEIKTENKNRVGEYKERIFSLEKKNNELMTSLLNSQKRGRETETDSQKKESLLW
jgi:hypothetical protein